MRKGKKFIEISLYNTNDQVLEAHIQPVKKQQLPKHFGRDMELLRYTAAHHQLVSLSANQIRMQHRVFALLKEPLINAGQWSGYSHQPSDYELIGNPERTGETNIRFKDFEECPSVPGMRFAIWNPILQSYDFEEIILNNGEILFKPSQRTLKGFIARLWDHQVRHLDGLLAFAQDISHGQIYVSQDFRQNPGMHEMVELMKQQIKLMSEQSLKKFFQKASDAESGPHLPSADQFPEQITKTLKSRLKKQKSTIDSQLSKEEESPKEQP